MAVRALWGAALGLGIGAAALVAACAPGNETTPSGAGGQGTGGEGTGNSFAGGGGSGGGFAQGGSGGGGPQPGVCDPMTCEAASGTCQDEVCVISENPGNIDTTTQGLLDGGGTVLHSQMHQIGG